MVYLLIQGVLEMSISGIPRQYGIGSQADIVSHHATLGKWVVDTMHSLEMTPFGGVIGPLWNGQAGIQHTHGMWCILEVSRIGSNITRCKPSGYARVRYIKGTL